MSLYNSPAFSEVIEIFNDKVKPVNHIWKCKIILPNKEYEILKVVEIDIVRDYINNFADEVSITIPIPKGFYNNEIIRYKDNVEFELIRTPTAELDTIAVEDKILVLRYKAIVIDTKNDIVSSKKLTSDDPKSDDLSDLENKTFQLIDKTVSALRKFETGGIYRNSIPGKAVHYSLTHAISKLNVSSKFKVLGVDMVTSDNTTPYKHVIIPHGTKLFNVPQYVQNNWGGIYNTSIGNYLQNNIWYIWPQYNTKRYGLEEKVLRVYNLPSSLFPNVERTYRINNKEVIILSTGESEFKDLSYSEKLNLGNGFRFTKGDNIMSGFDTVNKTDNNKYITNRNENNVEVKLDEWNDDSYAPVSPNRITNNLMRETSRISKRNGSYVKVVWESSNQELIYPGMPVKYIYILNNELQEINGVVIDAHHFIHDLSKGPKQIKHQTNTAITIFIERLKELHK